MPAEFIHTEKITSIRTTALFMALTVITLLLFAWSWMKSGWIVLTIILSCLFFFFLFCAFNYRTLSIRLTWNELVLKFGLIKWVIPLSHIASCRLDELPWLMKYGGAGVHFMFIHGIYRASINFLEYPRVVISLKKKIGPVREISFTTREPEDMIMSIRELTAASQKGTP